MIDLKNIDGFSGCVVSLKETSKDMTNNQYMNFSMLPVINFDEVKKKYAENLKINVPASCDALFSNGQDSLTWNEEDDTLIFVEFKNGCLQDPKLPFQLKKKIYDSILIASELIPITHFDVMRKKFVLIVVYNDEKNPSGDIRNEESLKNDSIQESDSCNHIQNTIASLGKQEIIQFKLEGFKGYCFKDVHTYTSKKFNEFLQHILKRQKSNIE